MRGGVDALAFASRPLDEFATALARGGGPPLVAVALVVCVSLAAAAAHVQQAAGELDNRSAEVEPAAAVGTALPGMATGVALFLAFVLVVGVVVASRALRE